MDSFSGKLAVVTGGGSGMGRELVRQLAAQGCSVAACDLNADAVAETAAVARENAATTLSPSPCSTGRAPDQRAITPVTIRSCTAIASDIDSW